MSTKTPPLIADGLPSNENPECPVGESRCNWLEELTALRRKYAILSEQARTDELTGLFNFRHFQEILPQEMERTTRTGSPTGLIILDLDFFKKVNDTWGHENGNRVLKQTANIICTAIRKIDVACRFGGEEIVLILPNTDITQGVKVAERIRQMIESSPVDVPQGEIRYTASLGVDVFTRDDHILPDQLLARVDELLYQAKDQGRNRVVAREIEETTFVSQEEKDMLLGS